MREAALANKRRWRYVLAHSRTLGNRRDASVKRLDEILRQGRFREAQHLRATRLGR